MRKIETSEELKNIQLNILLSFHEFCTKNGISYSLAAGSLIGAVRHKGFIPWDDDIDVYLLRKDYNKLIKVYPQTYKDHFCLMTMERDDYWYRPYGKLFDNRTLEIEDTRINYPGIGIGIDVFPIDDAPDDFQEWKSFDRKRRLLRDVYTLKSLTFSKKRLLRKNVIVLLGRFLLFPFSFGFIARCINRHCQINNGKGYNSAYESCWGVYNSKGPWLKKDMESFIDTEFEGKTIKIMQGYDNYLTLVYGDYMQLPPEEKRNSHHVFKAYWKD